MMESVVDSTQCTMSAINELAEIEDIETINVWSQDQTVLEKQALTEIEIFNKHSQDKEDGELSDNEIQEKVKYPTNHSSILNIDEYIKKQELLKKHLQCKKTSTTTSISEKSRNAAAKVGQVNKSRKRKTKEKENKTKKQKLVDDANVQESIHGEQSGSEYYPSEADSDNSDYFERDLTSRKPRQKFTNADHNRTNDDGDSKYYSSRLNEYYKSLENTDVGHDDIIEVFPGFKMNLKIWNNLYSYQQESVRWLHGLHIKPTGGLLGDEMGLGKTIQIIAYLHGLNYNRIISNYCRYTGLGPTIIVCPTTVIHQWVQHFHEWAPEFRVAVLHQSGSFTGNKLLLIKEIFKDKGIIVTSYLGILKYKGYLLELNWHYIILDEGHKIRNPSAKITVAIKQFRTPHKLMLTGSPMQNNLQELWSLFDFICPSMLGTLPVFMEHFAVPIMQGGYSNATHIQETTAALMASSLKSMITPYLLRRSKEEVQMDICLPQKSEQVLFCSLTDEQYDLYKGFLMSEHLHSILDKGGRHWFSQGHTKASILVAITTLRKICNHPNLYLDSDEEPTNSPIEESFGYYKRSGKMIVVAALLKIWKKQNHRVLLFTQGRAMITVMENFLGQQEYKYLKMDGSTNVKMRQKIINTFNEDTSYDVFLLTTRVGGLGINLTGADRVIIYDPDWNPATDIQARERAWRIGQDRQVTIYRLVSAGTIEEKMYQRQVWKQLLSNKVLLDPKTQKFFKTSDLHDLFSIHDKESTNNETANIFKNSRISLEERLKEKKELKEKKRRASEKPISFSEDKIEQMKKLAQEISKNIGKVDGESSKVKNKSVTQIEIEEEKEEKKKEKAYMKTLTPQQLMDYNKKKLLTVDDSMINKIDDIETEANFSKALEVTEKTSNIYAKIRNNKLDIDKAQCKYESLTSSIKKKDKSKKKSKKEKKDEKTVVDKSGKVDGERVHNLLKTEVKIKKVTKRRQCEAQDDYVLEKLFSKKGVHTALQHDVIVDSSKQEKPNKFRMHTEAQTKTDLALQAIRKSRIDKWRW